MTEKKTNPPRRPYHKPQLEEVQLKPEEAVLTNCKIDVTTSGPGWPGGNTCTNSGGQQACLNLGS